jgi:hypothetical protein
MTTQTNSDLPYQNCRICSQLKDYEYAIQTHGRPQEDSFIPKIAEQLKFVRSVQPDRGRHMSLNRCPECGTYYTYGSDHEYLATGSEEEQFLNRRSDEEAASFLAQPPMK